MCLVFIMTTWSPQSLSWWYTGLCSPWSLTDAGQQACQGAASSHLGDTKLRQKWPSAAAPWTDSPCSRGAAPRFHPKLFWFICLKKRSLVLLNSANGWRQSWSPCCDSFGRPRQTWTGEKGWMVTWSNLWVSDTETSFHTCTFLKILKIWPDPGTGAVILVYYWW